MGSEFRWTKGFELGLRLEGRVGGDKVGEDLDRFKEGLEGGTGEAGEGEKRVSDSDAEDCLEEFSVGAVERSSKDEKGFAKGREGLRGGNGFFRGVF